MLDVESNVSSNNASGQSSVFSRLTANKWVLFAAVGVLLFCIDGALSAGLLYYFSNPEPTVSLANDATPGRTDADSLLNPETAETLTATHTFDKIKSLVVNNRLATTGITLAIIAVLVGVIVTIVLLSSGNEVHQAVESALVDTKPEPEPVDPQPVVPEESDPNPQLKQILFGVGAVILALLAFAAATFFSRGKHLGAAQDGLNAKPEISQTRPPSLPVFTVIEQRILAGNPKTVCDDDNNFEFKYSTSGEHRLMSIGYKGNFLPPYESFQVVPEDHESNFVDLFKQLFGVYFPERTSMSQYINFKGHTIPKEMTFSVLSKPVISEKTGTTWKFIKKIHVNFDTKSDSDSTSEEVID